MKRLLRPLLPSTILAAETGNEIAGALAGIKEGQRFDISSVFVRPEYRRRGAGRALMDRLREMYAGKDVFFNAEYSLGGEEGRNLRYFLSAMDFEEETDLFPAYYIGNVEDMKADLSISPKLNNYILPLSRVPENELLRASGRSLEEGFPMPDGGLVGSEADKYLSLCLLEKGTIRAYITAKVLGKSMIKISSIWSSLPGVSGHTVLFQRISEELKEKYRGDTRLLFLIWDDDSYKVIRDGMHRMECLSYRYTLTDL